MSEEVLLSSEFNTGVFFTLSVEGVVILLDKIGAIDLRNELNEFIGEGNTSSEPRFYDVDCDEPDVPVGTRLRDSEGDILEKVDDSADGRNWSWVVIGGEQQSRHSTYPWKYVQAGYTFTEVV